MLNNLKIETYFSLKIKEILLEITKETDFIIKEIIVDFYLKGKTNKEVLNNYPISESSYYRLKNQILNLVYDFLIYYRYVSLKDILDEKIM